MLHVLTHSFPTRRSSYLDTVGGGVTCCASAVAASAASVVPVKSSTDSRVRALIVFEATLFIPQNNPKATDPPAHGLARTPAPVRLSNQARDPVPRTDRAQIVESHDQHQRPDRGKAEPKGPIPHLTGTRTPPNPP